MAASDARGPLPRLLRLARLRGVRSTLSTVLESYVLTYRQFYVFHRPIRPLPAPGDDEFSYLLATLADVDRLAVFEPYRRRAEFREWLGRGNWVFLALDGERPAGFHCVSHVASENPMFAGIRLAGDQVWTVDIYTRPEYRNRHVAAKLRELRDSFLFERGYRENLAAVRADNIPSLIHGYGGRSRLVRRVQRYTYLRVLLFRCVWIVEDALADLEAHLRRAGMEVGPGERRRQES